MQALGQQFANLGKVTNDVRPDSDGMAKDHSSDEQNVMDSMPEVAEEQEPDTDAASLSPEQEEVMDLVKQGDNVFFTGNAGKEDISVYCEKRSFM